MSLKKVRSALQVPPHVFVVQHAIAVQIQKQNDLSNSLHLALLFLYCMDMQHRVQSKTTSGT